MLGLGLGITTRATVGGPGGLPALPSGFFYLVDPNGAYVLDPNGAYVIVQVT